MRPNVLRLYAIWCSTRDCGILCPMKIVLAVLLLSGAMMLQAVVAEAQTSYHVPPRSLKCPGDKIVWLNTRSHIYHFQGERYFGSTEHGKFLCEHAADAEGDRPTRNGQ